MKSQAEEVDGGSLSEEQRLQLLTTAGRRNRLFMLGLAGMLGGLMLVSAGLNLYGLRNSADDARVVALEQQVKRLEQQVVTQQSALQHQEELLASHQATRLTSLFERAENPDSIAQVSKVLQSQERDYQAVMQGLKAGMRDLANMLPGSRSWLADYDEVIARAQLNSRARAEAIQAWSDKASAVPAAPAKAP